LSKNRRPRPSPGQRRQRQGRPQPPRHATHPAIVLNEEGMPAAVPDGPRPSPVVAVSAESRARYPWLPARVIAGSMWRGPAHERVRVDESGHATP